MSVIMEKKMKKKMREDFHRVTSSLNQVHFHWNHDDKKMQLHPRRNVLTCV